MRVHVERDARGRVPETLRDDVHRSARAQQQRPDAVTQIVEANTRAVPRFPPA
jgi:hypothetical protein